jgi:DNA-binding transcriptional MerR regulator
VSNNTENKPPIKLYYRIGEVSDLVGVEPHVLRYWETEFRSIRPQKSRKGQRVYSRRDVDKLLRVKELLYTQGYTIAGARKKLRDAGQEPSQEHDRLKGSEQRMRASLVGLRQEVAGMLREFGASLPASAESRGSRSPR